MTVDAIVKKGPGGVSLADVGFGRVGVDDGGRDLGYCSPPSGFDILPTGWQACGTGVMDNRTHKASFHAVDGAPLINTSKFASLKSLVDYGHSKGVKMGWYLVRNVRICSFIHESPHTTALPEQLHLHGRVHPSGRPGLGTKVLRRRHQGHCRRWF